MNHFLILIFFSFLFTQYNVINNIELDGLITANKNQIFDHSGLHPTEFYEDDNLNNLFDENETYIDFNNNGVFNYGTEISRGDELNIALENLWNLKIFSDIQIYVINPNVATYVLNNNNSVGTLIDVLIKVVELPILSNISFYGNKKIKNKELNEILNPYKSQRISNNDLFNLKNKIKDKYIEQSFHNVKVEVLLLDNNTDYSKDVKIEIIENEKLKINSICFNGNNNFTRNELIKNFEFTKEKKWYKFWKGNYDEYNFEIDIINLIRFYKNNGFRDVQILSKNIQYNDNGISIEIEVKEGEKNYFRNFSFNDNYKFNNDELLESLGLKEGDIFKEDIFNQSIYNLNKKYMDNGYYFIQIQNEVIPYANNQVDVNFLINESEKTKIRKILISGNDKTYDNVIRREVQIFPGDVFNMKKIEESYREIFILDFFENVNPKIIEIGESTDFVDIDFQVIEKETGRANFSMGYNEIHGLTGGGGFDFSNFRGKGQMLSISYNRGLQNQNQLGTQSISNNTNTDYESFSISFREPRIFDTRNSIGFSYSHSEQGKGANNLLKYDIISNRGSVLFGRKFDWPDHFFRGNWTLNIRNTRYLGLISELDDHFSDDIIIQENESYGYATRSGISINQIISRDSRNHPEFPSFGSKFLWSSTFSGSLLGGDENYHKHVFNFDWYNEMISSKVVLFQNFKLGALMELSENQFIPYSARFVLGGSGLPYGEMLRGYPDNGVGPKRNAGLYYDYDGGKVMLKYSAEIRWLLSESPTFYTLFFVEAGNIWSDFETIDIFKLKRSSGLGLRINMPMLGTLGYDVGYGFDSIYDDPNHPDFEKPYGWEHHLLFGIPIN